MRVAELTAYHVRIPLKKTIRHASYARRSTDNIVVRCRLTEGSVGWGEGVPREYVTGETIETAFEALEATDLRSQLSGTLNGLRDAVVLIDSLKLASSGKTERDCFGNATRCALELSVLDAVARAEQVPLSDVTQLVEEADPIRASRDQVRYGAAITAMAPMKQWLLGWGMRLYGFEQVKVKVGVDGTDDSAILKRIRRAVGPGMDLRIDANEAWTPSELTEKLANLIPYGITAVEQPVPHEVVGELSWIRPHIDVPIMLDESLCSLQDAKIAIDQGTCDFFNIRLSKCGGFIQSLRLAALAHDARLGYQLGCQVGESGILSAAGRHFATSVANIRYLEGSYDRHLVDCQLTQEDLTFGRGGLAPALNRFGLGVEVDQAAVSEIAVRERSWQL